MIYNYSQQLAYIWRVPTTRAPYKEFDKWCPWCIIHHTCPSGWAWVKFFDEEKLHLCSIEMLYVKSDGVSAIHVGTGLELSIEFSTIDQRKPPNNLRCGRLLTGREIIADMSIGGDRPECCLLCWDRLV